MEISTERPARLLTVSHTGLSSGAEKVLLRAMRAAGNEGWAVRCAAPAGPFADALLREGFGWVPLPDLKLPAGPRPVALGRLAIATAAAGAKLRRLAAGADVVLANGLQALLPLRLARPAVPVLWLVHDVLRRPDRLRYLRASAGVVDEAIAVSEAVRAPLEAAGLAVTVVRNGTDWPVAPAAPKRAGPRIVGCSAQLTSWKGQHVLLEALARLGRDDVRVELMGGAFPKDGPYVTQLRQRSDRLGVSDRVDLIGHQADPLARMRNWTIAVSASVDPEAAPLSVLEAMSLGLPMVATAHGGTPEVLDGAGLLVAPDDPGEMAAALARLLEDDALYRSCAAAGPAAISQGLTLRHQEERLLKTLASWATRGAPSLAAGGH